MLKRCSEYAEACVEHVSSMLGACFEHAKACFERVFSMLKHVLSVF